MSIKNTQEYISEYFKNEGWKNFSIYKNGQEKLNLECPEGHNCKISFNKFQQGNRCSKCSKKEKYTPEFVNNYFQNEGWCIETIFKNVKTKLKVICPNGHKQEKTFDKFKQGQRCSICFYKNNIEKNNIRYKSDRSRKKRLKYLQFSYYHFNILNDDPMYKNYLKYKKESKDNIYSVDHIFPRVAFIDNNLDKIYDEKIIKRICNIRENLKIVTKKYNTAKSGNYNQKEFITWFNVKLLKDQNFCF